jgi:hypothetical protein
MQHSRRENKRRIDKMANKYELVNRSLDKKEPATIKHASSTSITSANFIDVIQFTTALSTLTPQVDSDSFSNRNNLLHDNLGHNMIQDQNFQMMTGVTIGLSFFNYSHSPS